MSIFDIFIRPVGLGTLTENDATVAMNISSYVRGSIRGLKYFFYRDFTESPLAASRQANLSIIIPVVIVQSQVCGWPNLNSCGGPRRQRHLIGTTLT